MVKGKIQIPKEHEDCKNGKCGHPHEFPFEIEDPKPPQPQQPAQMSFDYSTMSNNPNAPQQTTQIPKPKEEPKKLSHDELAEVMPHGVNAMSCPGGDCGHMKLKNPKQTKKWKSCPHCEANTVPKDTEFCPYCTKNVDPDELDDGVELESEDEEE